MLSCYWLLAGLVVLTTASGLQQERHGVLSDARAISTPAGTARRKALQSDDLDELPQIRQPYDEKNVVKQVTRSRLKAGANPDEKRRQEKTETLTESELKSLPEKAAASLGKQSAGNEAKAENSGGGPPDDISSSTVLVLTTFMAAAAGLGALPFFFVGSLSKEWAALASSVACGVMLACSFDLMHEGQPYGGLLVVLGILLGAVFISASQQWLEQFEDVKFQGLHGMNARKIMLMIGIMAAHAFGEGAGVGVSFCGSRGWAQGVLVTLAIGLHNVPEGLAVATVLVARGISPRNALLWTFFTSMPQPLVAVPSFLFVDTFRMLLPVALGFAAGCMVWMVFAELLPDALADASHAKVATVGTFSAAWLEGLRMMLATLESGNGRLSIPDVLNGSTLFVGLLLTVPAILSGYLAGRASRALAKDKAGGIGLAAGVLAWQGGVHLANTLAVGPRSSRLPGLAWAAAGGLAVVLLGRMPSLWPTGEGKQKQDDMPVNPGGGIVVAAEQNGFGRGQPPLDDAELDLEMAGSGKRVFEPYRQPAVQNPHWGLVTVGLTATAAVSLSSGFHAAVSDSFGNIAAAPLWVPLAVRAVLPASAAAGLFDISHGTTTASLAAAAVASLAPATAFLERVHMEVSGLGDSPAFSIAAAASGATLVAGLWALFPAAKALHVRRSTKGFLKGFGLGITVHIVLALLCWQTPFCIR